MEERSNPMDKKRKLMLGGALALLVIAGGTGFAIAAGGDDEQPLTGSALDRASAAGLEHTGGGTVIEAEAGDDGAAYGVEIRLDDGSVVGVALDAYFRVVGGSSEDEAANEKEGTGDQNAADQD
jgi:uncharacterized membrane protein YkoI